MKKKWLSALLSLMLLFAAVVPVCAEETDPQLQQRLEEDAAEMGISVEEYTQLLSDTMFEYYDSYMDSIVKNYKFGVSKETLYEMALRKLIGVDNEKLKTAFAAAFDALDEHSEFFEQERFDDFTQKLDDTLCGIGATFSSEYGKLFVTGFPSENTPAKSAGICVGDELIAVDGRSVVGMDLNEVVTLVRGEEGTDVTVTFLRNTQEISFTITRAIIKQNNLTYEFLDNGILYLHLSGFNEGCSREVGKALTEADIKGVKKVIFDLRNNGGGFMNEACNIASMFLPKGMTVTSLEYNDPEKNEVMYSQASFTRPKYQTVLLVNKGTASASELFAGAMQDNKMGILIGTETFGKGSGQQITYLDALDAGYKLTVCRYRTPDGTYLPATGLLPDLRVENPLIYVDDSESIPQMTLERKLYAGDSGDDVKACQIRLSLLGYFPGNQNGEFSPATASAVADFQTDNGLYPCGDLDHVTQSTLYVKAAPLQLERDLQLPAAIEYLNDH